MPSMQISVPHQLSQDEAAQRLKGLLEKIKDKYQGQVTDLTEDWSDHSANFSFKAMGFTIKGTLDVAADAAKMNADLPFAAMIVKGKIEQGLRDAVTKALS